MLKKGVFDFYSITKSEIKKFNLFSDIFFFVNLIDALTTGYLMQFSEMFELNPIIDALLNIGVVYFLAFKILVVMMIIFVFRYLYAINNQLFSRKLIISCIMIFIFTLIICCINNVYRISLII